MIYQTFSVSKPQKTFQMVLVGTILLCCVTILVINGFVFGPVSYSASHSSFPGRGMLRLTNEVYTQAIPSNPYPELFIYRRSRKTGSTSMAHALLDALEPFGYEAFPQMWEELRHVIRSEFIRPNPRRAMLIYHNDITKDDHPHYRAVIADTFRDGFSQVTSQCRHMGHVGSCGEEIIPCMESNKTKRINDYRYPRANGIEDRTNYIDLPLSSAYPALSTTVLRTVFPGITLDINRYNIRDSTCNETQLLRKVYNKHYKQLEYQTRTLKRRMLVVAGYPYEAAGPRRASVTLDDMLEAAEQAERQRYSGLNMTPERKDEHSEKFSNFRQSMKRWYVDNNGGLQALVKLTAHDDLQEMEEE